MKNNEPPKTGRDLILSQAERLFSAQGYDGVSVRDIAGACRVSNAAIYYHFASKEELYIQVLIAALARMAESLAAAAKDPGTCRERLERLAHTHARLALSKRSLAQFAIRDLISLGPEAIERLMPKAHVRVPAVVEEVLRDGVTTGEIKPVDTALAAHLLMGMLNALNSQILLGQRDHLDQDSIRFVTEVFLDGIAAQTSSS